MKKKLLLGALAMALCLAIAVPALAATAKSSNTAKQPSATQARRSAELRRPGHRQARLSHGRGRVHARRSGLGPRSSASSAAPSSFAWPTRRACSSSPTASPTSATLSDIQAGNTLRIEGYLRTDGVFVAQRIQVLEPIPTDKLASFGCGGPVTAVDTTKDTVTVTVNNASRALYAQLGDPLTVIVNAGTDLTLLQNGVHTPITLSQVTVGETAWIAGTIDRTPTPPSYTATEMTVRPAPTPTATPVAAN